MFDISYEFTTKRIRIQREPRGGCRTFSPQVLGHTDNLDHKDQYSITQITLITQISSITQITLITQISFITQILCSPSS